MDFHRIAVGVYVGFCIILLNKNNAIGSRLDSVVLDGSFHFFTAALIGDCDSDIILGWNREKPFPEIDLPGRFGRGQKVLRKIARRR